MKLGRSRLSSIAIQKWKSPLLKGLVAYWKLHEPSDGSIPATRYDSVGTSHLYDHGNFPGNLGKIDNGAQHNNSAIWGLEAVDNDNISTGDFDWTLDFWVGKQDTDAASVCIAKLNGGGAGEFQINVSSTPVNITFELWRASTPIGSVTSANISDYTTALHYIQVYYVAATKEIGIIKDNLSAVTSTASNSTLNTAINFAIGSRAGGGALFHGMIDEVGFWKRRLTTNETSLRSSGASYPFDNKTSLEVFSPRPYQIMQRDGSNQANISISGTIVLGSGIYDIDGRWHGGSWTSIATSIASTFTGTLSAQSAGQGILEIRAKISGSQVVIASTSISHVGIGDVFIIAGQSNASGNATYNQVYSHSTLKAGLFANDYSWKELVDSTDSDIGQIDIISAGSSNTGSAWPLLATSIMSLTGFPVAFVPCAVGGSSIADWQPNANHLLRTTLYGSLNYRVGITGARAVLFHQGEQDVSLATSQSTYNAGLDTFANALNSDRGIIVLAAKIHNMGNATNVNAAIAEAILDNPNVKLGADNTGISTSPDGLHFTTDSEISGLASRWATAIQSAFSW